jgi:branched-chain amino acid transport system permease protein
MGSAIVFGLAYNMLLGQGGMLSFGHAVFYGLGCFFTVHAMNLAAKGLIWMPTSLLPLAGAAGGLMFGLMFGYVITRRAGTSFAMITFGIGELVVISAAMFPRFFGGEVGLSGNRVYGGPVMGVTYGPALQAYYLIAAWVLIATAGMYWFTRTPLGRIINAVRDNPERVAFIGYNAQTARYFTLVLSGLFSGLAGALAAINFETATTETLSSAQSGAVLLFTFIGGTGHFAGPILGAAVGTVLTLLVSTVSKAWPLYLGLFFIAVVKFAPQGLAGLIADGWRSIRDGSMRGRWGRTSLVALAAACTIAAFIVLIELAYHRAMDFTSRSDFRLLGVRLDSAAATNWIVALVIALAAGYAWMRMIRPAGGAGRQ